VYYKWLGMLGLPRKVAGASDCLLQEGRVIVGLVAQLSRRHKDQSLSASTQFAQQLTLKQAAIPL
jgi:hypothetical protein